MKSLYFIVAIILLVPCIGYASKYIKSNSVANSYIFINRDSVCMGDDMDSHEVKLEINDATTVYYLTLKIRETKYLPSIGGGKATWVLKYNNEPLAVVAQEWTEPKYLINKNERVKKLLIEGGKPEIYFEYILQENPDIVFSKLRNARRSDIKINGKILDFIKNNI
ncbi:MAG: hypothetical protein LLG02_09660 [Pelosinus sp.]|nr:hypothetical protein [Pelosinus sp.]